MTSLSIISKNTFLQSRWQQHFPGIDIQMCSSIPETQDVWILDCTALSSQDCHEVIAHKPESCFALLDKESLLTCGEMILDARIPILQSPLTSSDIQTVNHALQNQTQYVDDTEDTRKTYTHLAIEFAKHTENPKEMIQAIAKAVHDTMRADWVSFISISFDENEDYTVEVLGMFGTVQATNAREVIRPDGFTIHIMDTGFPVVIPDTENYTLDNMTVNPRLIKAGFKSCMGLPLLLGDGEPFGVMWVMYHQQRKFIYEDVRHMQVYASHAALAYNYPVQKKLVEQWRTAAQHIFTRHEASQGLSATLQQITDGIHESLDCDVVTLYLYQSSDEQLMPPYHTGAKFPDAIINGDSVKPESIVYRMLEETAPLILENAPADERFSQTNFLQREEIQSLVVMPLHRAGEKVGVVFLNYRSQRHFTVDEREAIAILTDQIAVPLLNARLDDEQQRSSRKNAELIEQFHERDNQLQTLVQVIDVEKNLNNQDRVSILKTIAQRTAIVAGADRVTIRLVQDDHVAALAIYPDEEATNEDRGDGWSIRDGGHSQYIVRTKNPVIISDVDNYDPATYDGIKINPRWYGVWKARIGLPMTSGEKTIGVMWLSFKEARTVTESQLSAFQTFANIAFITKMYDIEQERLQHALKVMSKAHQSINAAKDIDDILHQTTVLARQIVSSREESDACQSHLAVVTNQMLVFKAEHNQEETHALLREKLSPDASIALDCTDPCLVLHVIHKKETIRVDDVENDSRFLPLIQDEHTGTQMSVPIFVGEKIFAVVSVEHRQANSFEWYDEATLEWLASFVGQVIRNRKQQQMRDALFEASQAITHSKGLPKVLKSIAEHAHRVLEIKRGAKDHDAYVGLRRNNHLIFEAGYPSDTLKSIALAGFHEVNLEAEPPGISGLALRKNRAVLTSDTRDNPDAFQVNNASRAPLSLMSVPIPDLTVEQSALGVISLGHSDTNSFDKDDEAIITLLAKFAAVAIRRAQEIEEQEARTESLFELTHAAMHQVIAAHDLNNFRMIYNLNFPELRDSLLELVNREEDILRTINDSSVFDAIESALQSTQETIQNLDDAYHSLIDRDARLPELGDKGDFLLRDWLWTYHKEKHVHLHIDDSLTDYHHCRIPKYWLREVIKIVLDNAARSIKQNGIGESDRLIRMMVAYNPDTKMVDLLVTNPGKFVPDNLRSLLTYRVIPKDDRTENSGRGIGLFMSGIIMRAYKGDIRYAPTETEPAFLLNIPVS